MSVDTFDSSDLDLWAACINTNDNAAWAAFRARYHELVRRVFAAYARSSRPNEFIEWLPGWLYVGHKLHFGYRAYLRQLEAGASADATYLENYLAACVRSAVADFFNEQAGPARTFEPPVDPTSGTRWEEVYEDIARLRTVLDRLQMEIRVPFRLRYYHVLGPLTDDEADWTARQTGRDASEIRRRIDDSARQTQGREFPLDADFIGQLLNIEPRASGGYHSIIDQRVRRARVRIRELLESTSP